jgi:hypothetical protein
MLKEKSLRELIKNEKSLEGILAPNWDLRSYQWGIEDNEDVFLWAADERKKIYDYNDETLAFKICIDKDNLFSDLHSEYSFLLDVAKSKVSDKNYNIVYVLDQSKRIY